MRNSTNSTGNYRILKKFNKWKYIKDPKDASKKIRIIRARLCLRGFKDCDAEGLINYAGTAGRTAQKIVVSEAIRPTLTGG